jgi:signal transduction histidine kinase/DNA-binding response OmpR family regulator
MLAHVNFQELFDHLPSPHMLLSRDLRFVEMNRAYLRVTGRTRDELLGEYVFDAFPGDPDDAGESGVRDLRASFEYVLREGRPHTLPLIRYPIPRDSAEGRIFEERVWSTTHTPILDEQGDVAFILQNTVDVTELQKIKKELREARRELEDESVPEQMEEGVFRRAQVVQEVNRALKAEREHYRRLFEQAPGFIAFLSGPEHVFELANEAYYQLVGKRDLIGKRVREALPEIAGQGYADLLDSVYRSGEAFVGQEMLVKVGSSDSPSSGMLYLDFVYQPIVEPDGTISGVFVQGSDVTERKRARDELALNHEELEERVRERTRELEESQAALRHAQKMEAVGQLTGGVAHDFNNLLQIIRGNLQLMDRERAGDDRLRRLVEMSLGAVERGSRLSGQLLVFARRQALDPCVINPGRLVRSLSDLIRRAVGEAVTVDMHLDGEVWNTFADPGQLENVVLNLVINARDAMEEGRGRLVIRAENTVLNGGKRPRHSALTAGDYVAITITDNGRGMPPEVLERVFEPFYSTKPEGQGTGLGLSMTYGFVRQSGGDVLIESEPGRGTTVRLLFPKVDQPEVVTTAQPAVTDIPGGTETILVVEDDYDVRATVVATLSGLGYQVIEAANAGEALEMVRRRSDLDLVFSDVVMPGELRVTEMAMRIREIRPHVEILFTSGYPETELASGGRLDAGVSLLSKPYPREKLAQRIREILDARPVHTPDARGDGEVAEAPAAASTGDLSILLVEDDMDVRLATSMLLEELGYSVVPVDSAEKGIGALREGTFNVLFTDLRLTGMSGSDLARIARDLQPEIRLIVASGVSLMQAREQFAGLDDVHFLQKPYTIESIAAVLQAVATEVS